MDRIHKLTVEVFPSRCKMKRDKIPHLKKDINQLTFCSKLPPKSKPSVKRSLIIFLISPPTRPLGCVLFVRDSFSVWMKDESSDESSEFLLCLISLLRHLKAISLRQRLAKQRLNSSHHLTYSLSSCSLNSNLSSIRVLEGLPW